MQYLTAVWGEIPAVLGLGANAVAGRVRDGARGSWGAR